ncbi:epoxide hydrolase 1 [Galendromus occidentalis]|uniref:Epoxide hydrolase n=1 Tax=Galendromus occidentalis TaxID=34638 RepID=A0AAJ6W050_9ACAR|nr:epoxide hydrolase 1 [Galendromus occidentalis]
MGCVKCSLTFLIISGIALAALVAFLSKPAERPALAADGYWGPKKIAKGAALPKDKESVDKFSIEFDAKMIAGLREELSRTKWFDPLEDAAYHYGVNLRSFKDIIEHWRTKFDFAAAQQRINAFPHYKTEIEGLNIHFFRSLPQPGPKIKVIPILMIHGWPGSFVEFLKITPLLSEAKDGVSFDIIVPSLPGYGYSDPAKKQGVDIAVTARIFSKLMKRLGYSKYYVQGGDWGAAIANAMGIFYPENLRGIHMNMVFADSLSAIAIAKQTLFGLFPNYFGDGQMPKCMMVPYTERVVDVLREAGYMHFQSTKPDTVGFSLLNSPAGLAAYISEKFSTWTQPDFRFLDDGGHGKKFTVDDILTNIMVYYATGSIISSQRYYRENFATGVAVELSKIPVFVPTGYAVFPNEVLCVPKFVASTTLKNITTMTYQKDGGHFAAFEQPDLLEKDIRLFVKEVEKLYPEQVKPPTGFAASYITKSEK